MKNRAVRKITAIILTVITVFSISSAGISASAADDYLIPERMATSIITTAAGAIPVIGSLAAKAFEPLLTKALGINVNAQILDKLDEISEKIDNISLQMDQNTQTILQQLYGVNLNTFNDRITSLRTMVLAKYRRLEAIEAGADTAYNRELLTAELLKFDYDNKDDFAVLAESLAKYINGTQITLVRNEGIYAFAYKASCADSVLGCEAAIKTAGYVNEVNEVLSAAYKLMMIVLTEKVYVYQNYADIMAAAETDAELANTVAGTNMTVYGSKVNANEWNKILGDEETGYIYEYNIMFDMDDSRSAVAKYNNMIKENWFSFISGTKYGTLTATVEYIPLGAEIGCTTVYRCGLNRDIGRYGCESMAKNTTATLNSRIHSALTKAQLQKLYSHLCTDPVFLDENGNRQTIFAILENLGFNFDAWRYSDEYAAIESLRKTMEDIFKEQGQEVDLSSYTFIPAFALDATSKWKNVDNSMERYWDETANYTAFIGNDAGVTGAKTIEYYHYHEAQGCYSKETGDQTWYAVMYFTAA